ncbi:MAG TPA: hypothetical protein VFU71_23920 [Burkholderiaceae bacterium]|nr:hypothetical protein [Burkholderiaceae bacterium]
MLTTAYWSVFALVGDVGVLSYAKWMLYACCLSSWWWVRAHGQAAWATASLSWLSRAGQSVLLALLFYGGNAGRDVLFGPDRLKAATPEWLGGLELWWILCPGVASVALAAAAAQLSDRVWKHGERASM